MWGAAMFLFATLCQAQVTTNWWTYNGNQSGSPGTNWAGTGVTAYWKLNGAGTAATPAAGTVTATATNYNFYSLTNNGTQLGNGTATALVRNPYTGTPNVISFPGDTLILQTNAQLRFKNLGGVGTFVSGVNYATPTNVFPGNFGFPGLILNGGVLNNGTSGTAFVIQGTMYANPGSQSYLNPADTFNQDTVSRGLIFQAQLMGSGTLALLNGNSGPAVPVPTPFTGTSNNFTGLWIVKSGWLQGVGDGTSDGYNSLGTNPAVSFDIDPQWAPPQGPGLVFTNGSTYFYNGPAVLDMGPSLANSGGSLFLTNGGQLYLHGNVVFSNVTVEGTSLARGTYTYSYLAATYPNNFAPSVGLYPNQGGTLTIQGYGPAAIPAQIINQPLSEILYPTRNAVFTVGAGGSPPLTYQWYKNSSALSDSGNISGSATSTLTVSGVAGSDDATFSVVVSNAFGAVTSSNATLLVVTPVQPYEAAVSNLNPLAYYQFDETNNPATGAVRAYDYAGGFNGTYGTSAQNGFDGITGPDPAAGFPGFAATNDAIILSPVAGNFVSAPAWNLNGNTVTMVAWLNPAGVEEPAAGVIVCRGANTVAGLDYTGTLNTTIGQYDLGYIWNNDAGTYSWDSGLTAPAGQWSMVTLVVSPTDATIYVMNIGGLTSSTHVYPHVLQAFDTNNTTLIGEDSFDGGNGTRSFLGQMDEVAIFNYDLTKDQIANLFYAATTVTNYAPVIGVQPVSSVVYVGQTYQLSVGADGSEPLTYQWAAGTTASGGPYTNLTDGNGITGSTTPTLTFQSITLADALDYICIVSNTAGHVESTPATLTVQPVGAPVFNITMSQQEATGADWNTVPNWSDNNPASVSAISEPGSIYEVLPGARLRTPATITYAVFPGNELLLDGTGVWINNPAAGTTQGEIRMKQTIPTIGLASVTFPLLVMNGGQLDLGNDGVCIIDGVINVLSNGIFYSDSPDDRGYIVNAQLTGTNSIQYFGDSAAYPAGYTNSLDIAGTNNTFSGPWLVGAGMLLGSASNSLGTNNIAVSNNAVFETLYNINDSQATLTLSGQMLLTQTDTFRSVFLGSAPLQVGTYTAAYLCSNYPAYFPSNWIPRDDAATPTNAVGSITVLFTPGPSFLQQPASLSLYPSQTAVFTASAGGTPPLGYRWYSNNVALTDGGAVSGSTTPTLTIENVVPADAASYTLMVTNALAGDTSDVATLTVLPTLPAIIPITMSVVEPAGDDWNTPAEWTDGQGGLPASISAVEFPGSTYEVLSSGLLRTPGETTITYTNFPGIQLQVDGQGIFAPAGGGNGVEGELRFKPGQPGISNYFPLLILAGGQLDNGSSPSTLAEISGEMDATSNSFIYVDSGGGEGRPFQLDCYLTGSGGIFFHDFDATLSGGIDLTCASNTYTGAWFVDQGPLFGAGVNSLGTGSIEVNTNGVLETLYDIHDPNSSLSLSNGARIYLHQNDVFQAVDIDGIQLAPGTYTFAQLTSQFPANFPATWSPLFNSPYNAGSGSITVGAPVMLDFLFSAKTLTLTWSQGSLLQTTNLAGPWTTNETATSPFVVSPTNAQEFYKLQLP